MDCRGPLTLALGFLIIAGAGCLPSPAVPVQQPPPDLPTGEPLKELAESKKPPRAPTCVSLARIYEQQAADPKCPAGQRDVLFERARKCYQQALSTDPKNL